MEFCTYSLDLLVFCLFFTELKNCERQRQRARWLAGHWKTIRQVWMDVSGKSVPDSSPSQSTLSRLVNGIDVRDLIRKYYLAFEEIEKKEDTPIEKTQEKSGDIKMKRHYAVDGKARKGCISEKTGRTEMDLTIFRVDNRQVVARTTLAEGEGETKAACDVLTQFASSLAPGIVTGDAAYASPAFVETVVSCGHEYILSLKGNAGNVFLQCQEFGWNQCDVLAKDFTSGHGREEKRSLRRIAIGKSWQKSFAKYPGCTYLFQVRSERTENGKTTIEDRYFIGSSGLKNWSRKELLALIRGHWIQENGLHWVKDVILGEDNSSPMSSRSSRVLSFFKDIVVAIGYSFCKSVQQFVDEFDADPWKFVHQILATG